METAVMATPMIQTDDHHDPHDHSWMRARRAALNGQCAWTDSGTFYAPGREPGHCITIGPIITSCWPEPTVIVTLIDSRRPDGHSALGRTIGGSHVPVSDLDVVLAGYRALNPAVSEDEARRAVALAYVDARGYLNSDWRTGVRTSRDLARYRKAGDRARKEKS